jgi:hypothetical protein
MKRDMDLIRKILLKQEGEEAVNLSEYTQDQINYHIVLLIEVGFLDGKIMYSSRGRQFGGKIPDKTYVTRITWAGHEFLDQARNNTTWEKAKQFVMDKGQSLSFDSIKIALGIVIKTAMT